MIQNTRDTEDI